jgi:hypothetical protein
LSSQRAIRDEWLTGGALLTAAVLLTQPVAVGRF